MGNIRVITTIDKVVKMDNEFKPTLSALQDIVGDYLEAPMISKLLVQNGIDMYINEEGKFENLPITAVIESNDMQILDTINGKYSFRFS